MVITVLEEVAMTILRVLWMSINKMMLHKMFNVDVTSFDAYMTQYLCDWLTDIDQFFIGTKIKLKGSIKMY